jgi:hypothetical protein
VLGIEPSSLDHRDGPGNTVFEHFYLYIFNLKLECLSVYCLHGVQNVHDIW